MTKNVDAFVEKIDSIFCEDYGDFMRAANVYLNHLRTDFHRDFAGTMDSDIEQKLTEIQGYLQFTPNWDVGTTRKRLLKDVRYIDELAMGHEQDWESENLPPTHPS